MKQRQQHLRSPAATVHPTNRLKEERARERGEREQESSPFQRAKEHEEKEMKNKKMQRGRQRREKEREGSSLVAANKQVVDHQVNS